jgi:imidazolonepropionase-like amidohydrolase
MGLAGEVGTLRPGASADIIAVKGDPRSDLTRLADIDFVIRAGQLVRSPSAY